MDAKLFWDKVKKAISDQGKTFVWLCAVSRLECLCRS